MSDYLNKVLLIGNLGHDPELRKTAKGNPVLSFSLATNREFKTAEGEKKRETDWHRATMWGKRAEKCAKYLTKGSRIYLEGELRNQVWTDKEGVERKTAEITVEAIKFLGQGSPVRVKEAESEENSPVLTH